MGGIDKGLQKFRGLPMIVRVIGRLKPQVDKMIINANRNLDVYRAFGRPVFADASPEFSGLLAALHTGLMHCETPYMATVPCDAPFLPADLVARLYIDLLINDADVAIASTGSAADSQTHPEFAVVKSTVLPQLTSYLQSGGRSIEEWHATLKVARLHFDEVSSFRKLATLDDLTKFDAP